MKNFQSRGVSSPEVYISVNKNRQKFQKVDGIDTIYLDNGTEFQLEFYNPTSQTVLAKISNNGKLISTAGLVIRPGERVWLDRNINDPSKFLFRTYEVDGTEETKKAIANNGNITVEFFYEKIIYNYPTYTTTTTTTITPDWPPITTTPYYGTGTGDSHTYYKRSTYTTDINCTCDTNSRGFGDGILFDSEIPFQSKSKSIETGRIEKGSYSNQQFETVSMDFNSYSSKTVTYKILPTSQKKYVTSNDLKKKHCTNCGKKCKCDSNFCSKCGCKL